MCVCGGGGGGLACRVFSGVGLCGNRLADGSLHAMSVDWCPSLLATAACNERLYYTTPKVSESDRCLVTDVSSSFIQPGRKLIS